MGRKESEMKTRFKTWHVVVIHDVRRIRKLIGKKWYYLHRDGNVQHFVEPTIARRVCEKLNQKDIEQVNLPW